MSGVSLVQLASPEMESIGGDGGVQLFILLN